MAKCNLNWIQKQEFTINPDKFCCNSKYIVISASDSSLIFLPISEESISLHTEPIASLNHAFEDTFIISYLDGLVQMVALSPNAHCVTHTLSLGAPISHVLFQSDRLFIADESSLYLTDIEFSYCFSIFTTDRIVQLSQFDERDTLVSSYTKTFIIKDDGVIQIGRKERNGAFGACQLGPTIYASRPNGNIWEANTNGTVMSTVSYRTVQGAKVNFGLMYTWTDQFILSHTEDSLLILEVGLKEIFYKRDSVKIYFNQSEHALYILDGSLYYAELQTSLDIFASYLKEQKLEEAIALALSDPSLQKLCHLEQLCKLIFVDEVETDNKKLFIALIDELEAREELSLPTVEFVGMPKRGTDV